MKRVLAFVDNRVIYVPAGRADTYKNNSKWSAYASDIREISE